MSSNRKRHSTNDSWRLHPYLLGIPTQELERANIIREGPRPDSHVRIIQNGKETYNSRNK